MVPIFRLDLQSRPVPFPSAYRAIRLNPAAAYPVLHHILAGVYRMHSECYQIQGKNNLALKYAKIGLKKLSADSTINENFRTQLRDILNDRLENLDIEETI